MLQIFAIIDNTSVMNFRKKLQHNFPKMSGGGQRPFGTFPKIHPFWKGNASLRGKEIEGSDGLGQMDICLFGHYGRLSQSVPLSAGVKLFGQCLSDSEFFLNMALP